MSDFLEPTDDCDCACEDAVLCGCCGEDTKSYSESHGFDECPDVAKPCGGDDSGSCSGATISGDFISKEFPEECFEEKTPKASFVLYADNYGYVQGAGAPDKCSNFGTDECVQCFHTGIVDPIILDGAPGFKKMKVLYFAQNAPHGGPYSIDVTVDFYFE